jgi:hypothetical protein
MGFRVVSGWDLGFGVRVPGRRNSSSPEGLRTEKANGSKGTRWSHWLGPNSVSGRGVDFDPNEVLG